MNLFNIVCPCHFGLESILADEVRRIGGINVTVLDGKVEYQADSNCVIESNIWLRTAERVLIKLGEFKATCFEDLFEGVKQIKFHEIIGKNDAFPVKGWSLKSKLFSIPDCQSIIKKAIVESLKGYYNTSWFQETGPVHQIRFSIHKDLVYIMIDTSGVSLHKRGYRKAGSVIAPIKETLAAGIASIARVNHSTVLYDPFCGSGTFSIESAMKSFNIPPGLYRRFSLQDWGIFSKSAFKEVLEKSKSRIFTDSCFHSHASDIDNIATNETKNNSIIAKVIDSLSITQMDISSFAIKTPNKNNIILCNPPYGQRLLEVKESEKIYTIMGRVFNLSEGKFYIISSHPDFEYFFGTPADKKRKLYNGMIKCYLYMYFKRAG